MDGNVIIKIPNGTGSVAGGGEENGNKLSVRRMVRLLRQSPGGRVGPGQEEVEWQTGEFRQILTDHNYLSSLRPRD